MSPEHKRIVEMGAAWEDSEALVTLGPADADTLKALGAPLKVGKRETDPVRIVGDDLFHAGELIKRREAESVAGVRSEAPKQVVAPATPPIVPPAPPIVPPVQAPAPADALEERTVAELREIAAAENVTIASSAVKATIIEAIRKARTPK